MPENVSQVIIHYHYDNSSDLKLLGIVSCVVLIVFIVLVVLIVLAGTAYLIARRGNCGCRHSARESPLQADTNSRRERGSRGTLSRDLTTDVNSNVAMSMLKQSLDRSVSSAGLAEILFPPQDGDLEADQIVQESPPKVVAFSGRETPQAGPSAPTESSGTKNSLEWDYFESRHYGASNASEESAGELRRTVDVCWV